MSEVPDLGSAATAAAALAGGRASEGLVGGVGGAAAGGSLVLGSVEVGLHAVVIVDGGPARLGRTLLGGNHGDGPAVVQPESVEVNFVSGEGLLFLLLF